MVRSPTLFADCAISRAVISSYPGRGAPAMAALVAVIARVIVVSCFTLFDVILFGTTVLAACGIYTLALRQAASGSFSSLFGLNKLKDLFKGHVLIPFS